MTADRWRSIAIGICSAIFVNALGVRADSWRWWIAVFALIGITVLVRWKDPQR